MEPLIPLDHTPMPMDNPNPSQTHTLPFHPGPSQPPNPGFPPPMQQTTNPNFPPPPLQQPPFTTQGQAATYYAPSPGPAQAPALTQSPVTVQQPLRAARSTAEFALREYLALQRRPDAPQRGERLRAQAAAVQRDLRALRRDVLAVAKAAEGHRWRRWLFGGLLGGFVPVVRRLFRRPGVGGGERGGQGAGGEVVASNDTEYAFAKSRSLISRILDSVHGRSGLASVAFFVFAVLYVFQNEVALRVARTVAKRLKRLDSKVQRDEEVNERDMELLAGWRWRVLMWNE